MSAVAPIHPPTPIHQSQQDRFALCHSFGHEWHHESPVGMDDARADGWTPPLGMGGMIVFPSVCRMCTTERMRWVGRSGENLNRYRYPDGYQRRASRGEEVLTPREWRRNYVADIFARFDTGVAPVLPGPARRRGAR